MPWAKGDYPPSMKNLHKEIRNKAVEIANALLADGVPEGIAIATGVKRAKEWFSDKSLGDEDAKK